MSTNRNESRAPVEALAEASPSVPYRAPIHSELVVDDEAKAVTPVATAMGSIVKACAIALIVRGALVGIAWLYSVRTDSALPSLRWTALVAVPVLLWWVSRAGRTVKAFGFELARGALCKELFVLCGSFAVIEWLPWSSRWFVELWGVFAIVLIAILFVVRLFTAKRWWLWQTDDGTP